MAELGRCLRPPRVDQGLKRRHLWIDRRGGVVGTMNAATCVLFTKDVHEINLLCNALFDEFGLDVEQLGLNRITAEMLCTEQG